MSKPAPSIGDKVTVRVGRNGPFDGTVVDGPVETFAVGASSTTMAWWVEYTRANGTLGKVLKPAAALGS